MHRQLSLFALLAFFCTTTLAQAALPAIEEIKSPKVKRMIFKDAKRNKPIKITSAKDAEKYLQGETMKQLKKVDFEKQTVLIFAWRGSGGDKLNYVVAESFPEQITFSIKRGLTKDLRPHVRVFVLRSNVKWRVR